MNSRLGLIFDTSPLITLCAFKAVGRVAIEHILPLCDLVVVEAVALESTAHLAYPDALVIDGLLKTSQILRSASPVTAYDTLIDSYVKLGQGERDTIRLALTLPQTKVVLDDYLAFVIVTRFDVPCILLLDLFVLLVEDHGLKSEIALEIVKSSASRYSPPFVEHTKHKLNEVKT